MTIHATTTTAEARVRPDTAASMTDGTPTRTSGKPSGAPAAANRPAASIGSPPSRWRTEVAADDGIVDVVVGDRRA